MAGILNKKIRFIDLALTQEAKRQIAAGELKVEYASLTDMHAVYEKNQYAKEVGNKIYFEVADRPENSIVLEKDDSGKIIQKDVLDGALISDNKIQAKVILNRFDNFDNSNQTINYVYASGSQFASLSEKLTRMSITHLEKNQIIASNEYINRENKFTVNKENISFVISNSIPFKLGPTREIINIDDTDSFLEDKKLANLPNFQFLPPENEDGTNYGTYTDIRNTTTLDFEDIINSLGIEAYKEIEKEENDAFNVKKNIRDHHKVYNREDEANFKDFIKKEYETINFLETSTHNNLLIQVYETGFRGDKPPNSNNPDVNSNKISKLDIIDGGVFSVSDDINNRNEKHVFYVGKIQFDSDNIPKFLNIFTIIFD